MEASRISIITICFNNKSEVEATCASVDRQKTLPHEQLIIDGSTTPEIKQWVESTPQPSYRRSIHERDKGIADAFNKGIRHATGDILVFLNSGDTLYDENSLSHVVAAFEKAPDLMWVHGKIHLYRGGRWVIVGKPFEKEKLYRGMRSISHQTMYVRKEVFDRHGGFDTSLRFSMDYDFVCRIADEKNAFIPEPLATFDPHGITNTRYLESMAEGGVVFRRYFNQPVKLRLWRWRLKLLYYLLNSPIGKTLYRIKAGLKLENM